MDIKIDSEFRDVIPPLSAEEYAGLEANILADGCMSALASVTAYKKLGRNGFEWMLRLINQFWAGQKNNAHRYIISGMALFLDTYKDALNEVDFVKRMSHTTPQAILDAARTDQSSRQADIRVANQIRLQYNGSRKVGTLPYRFG